MNSKHVYLELSPHRIDGIVTRRGASIASFREKLELTGDERAWSDTFTETSHRLAQIVEDQHLHNALCHVLYRSPTLAVDVEHLDLKSTAQACEATVLSLADSLSYSIDTATTAAMVLGRDGRGDNRRTHVVAAAERDDRAAAIAEMIETAGMRLASITPADVVEIASTLRTALRHRGSGHARLHIGLYQSYFVAANNGVINFDRRINMGVEALVRSLTLPIRMDDGHSHELSLDEARRILCKHGLAQREDLIDQTRNLCGVHLMPLMQPVLQRFLVEMRQSLRYGLTDQEKSSLTVQLCGPGSSLLGLGELIGDELNLSVVREEAAGLYDDQTPAAPGSPLHTAISHGRVLNTVNLLPGTLTRSRLISTTKRWMWAGAAATILLSIIDGFAVHSQLDKARHEAESALRVQNQVAALEETRTRLAAAKNSLREVASTINKKVGRRVDIAALLRELGRTTPAGIRLVSINVAREHDRAGLELTGYVQGGDTNSSGGDLEGYIASLSECPLFHAVELGNVQRGSIGEIEGQRFQVTLEPVSSPQLTSDAQFAAVGSEPTP